MQVGAWSAHVRPNLTRSDAIDTLRMRSYPPLLICRPPWTPLTAYACLSDVPPAKEVPSLHPGYLQPPSSTPLPELCQSLESRAPFFCAVDSPAGLRSRNYVPCLLNPPSPSLTPTRGLTSYYHLFYLFSYQQFY